MKLTLEIDRGRAGMLLSAPDGCLRQAMKASVRHVRALLLELAGRVQENIRQMDLIGATGMLFKGIHVEGPASSGGGIEGSVESDRPYAGYMEEGFPGGSYKSAPLPAGVWIGRLYKWVERKINPSPQNVGAMRGRGGLAPRKGGTLAGRARKRETKDQAIKRVAIMVGRKIEKRGIEGRHYFANAMEVHGEPTLNKLADLYMQELDAAMSGTGRAA